MKNDENKITGNNTIDVIIKDGRIAREPENLTKDKNLEKKRKEKKIFVPSEKIPADQGVDFPYDI